MTQDHLYISIAEWSVHLDLVGCTDTVRARLADHYRAFLIAEPSAEFSIQVCMEPGDEYIPIHQSSVWQVKTTERNGHIDFMSFFEKGWVDLSSGKGELTMRPSGDPENFLRVMYAWLCVEHGSMLAHASGIISNDKGYVFFGHSGAGKTTVSNFSLDRTVLSDDMVIIKKRGDKFFLFGVPFRGDMIEAPRTNAFAELRGLFSLVKNSRHSVVPMASSDAVGRLASCVPFVMAHPQQSMRVLQVCADIAQHVPIYALHFRRDPGFWKVIDGLDQSSKT